MKHKTIFIQKHFPTNKPVTKQISLKNYGCNLRLQLKGFAFIRSTAWEHVYVSHSSGNTKGGSIAILFTFCLIGLDQSVLQIKTKIVSCHTADSKRVKQEVNSTVILPPLVFPAQSLTSCWLERLQDKLACLKFPCRQLLRQS